MLVSTKDKARLGGGSSWGLLCPAGNVAWISEAKIALSRAGVRLNQVQQTQNTEQLDGLI